MIFDEIGLPAKRSGRGMTMIALGGLFVRKGREPVEMLYESEKPCAVDSTAIEKAFGRKATPLPEAIRATLAWTRSHPRD